MIINFDRFIMQKNRYDEDPIECFCDESGYFLHCDDEYYPKFYDETEDEKK